MLSLWFFQKYNNNKNYIHIIAKFKMNIKFYGLSMIFKYKKTNNLKIVKYISIEIQTNLNNKYDLDN